MLGMVQILFYFLVMISLGIYQGMEIVKLDELPLLNWIISAFNLCNAAFIPFWGQIADVFGRYTAIQSALITAFVGTTLCASAPNTAFPMLLIGRALQGAGCAGLLIVTKIILADKVSLEENAKNNTIFILVITCKDLNYTFILLIQPPFTYRCC